MSTEFYRVDVHRPRSYFEGRGILPVEYIKIKRALLSVSDKTGIVELAQALMTPGD